MLRWILALGSIAALPAHGQSIDRIVAAAAQRDAASGCSGAATDEILVCGDRDRDRRYRVPFPSRRDPLANGAVAGEVPPPRVDSPYLGGCGIFAGQRRCARREAMEYGYGGGRDPLTLVGRLVRKAIDADAEIGPPAPARD